MILKIELNLSFFAENLVKMVDEYIYDRFVCTYAYNYDGVEKIHNHSLTCSNITTNNETSAAPEQYATNVHNQSINVTHHEL